MLYTVIFKFKDLNDNGHIYQPGDSFPRAGATASQKRLAELSGSKNKAGRPLIKAEEEPAKEEPAEEEPKEEKPKKAPKKSTKKGK